MTTTDVLLICALKDEYDQVLQVNEGLLGPGWVEGVGPKGWIVADGSFETPTQPPLSVRTTWATHMGREQAQAVASLLIQEQSARCLAMCGICAGRRGKVALGDVIFADRLWSYDQGKQTVEDGRTRFQGDIVQFQPSPTWIQRMQHMRVEPEAQWLTGRPKLPLEWQEDWILLRLLAGEDPRASATFAEECPDWSSAIPRLRQQKLLEQPMVLTDAGRARAGEALLLHPAGLPGPAGFQVHVAPIATGAAVVEDVNIFEHLSGSMRKVLGVEMEASALGALGAVLGTPVIVAKGVSDYGDPFKDDRYREFAARAAAECLIRVLRSSAGLLPDWSAPPETAPKGLVATTGSSADASVVDLQRDLILTLAEQYPDVRDARALWGRAGGKASDVESVSRPQDLWQRLWTYSVQGATVRPAALLRAALDDLPNNPVLLQHLTLQCRATST